MTVSLKLEETRRNDLERIFWELSDPDHANYGKYLSIDEIKDLLAVPQKQIDTVSQYFLNAGATSAEVSKTRDTIQVKMPAAKAEAALNTKLYHFTHSQHEDANIVRASHHYALPDEVAPLVSMVGELLQFPRLPLKHLRNLNGSQATWKNVCGAFGCQNTVQPDVLAKRYKVPTSTQNAGKNSMAVAEFQGQFYLPDDLSKFSTSCKRDVTVATNVGKNQPSAGVESELDIEYIKAIAPEVPLTVVYNGQYSLLDWVNQITNLEDSPLVHSVSYGNDEVQQSSRQYMYTCNTAFMKAGARGLSILFTSGDQGVCGRTGCGLFQHARFHPDFPAASPYITAVGGTDFAQAGVIGDEMVWSAGGGGFSDTFDQPAYQKQAVAAYKASPDADLPPAKLWNNTGRGYPDVAALGGLVNPYCVASSGMFQGVAGTSASSPVVAGIFALLNGLRTSQNASPLGFLNPLIYQNGDAFNDVTSGVNGGGRKYGFKAIKGWDAATGWGTPDYEALAKVVMQGRKSAVSVVV